MYSPLCPVCELHWVKLAQSLISKDCFDQLLRSLYYQLSQSLGPQVIKLVWKFVFQPWVQ